MVSPLEQKKRQKILIIILIVVAVITVFVWYLITRGMPSIKDFIPEGIRLLEGPSPSEMRLKGIELDFSILDSDLFQSLKSHGDLPVTVEEVGRENPFVSY